jgi:gliding motility-associated-like protein
MEGKIFVPTAFAPKGKNRIWLPVTHFIDKTEYTVSVFDRWGKIVFETHDDKVGWNGNGATNDVYAYLITYKNSRGEYKEVKGTVLLME